MTSLGVVFSFSGIFFGIGRKTLALGQNILNNENASVGTDIFRYLEIGHNIISGDRFNELDLDLSEQLLEKGNMIPMQDGEGNVMNGIVLETNDKAAKLDFNHPLAGERLFFDGAVLDVREATEEEIEHGHVHGEHDHEEEEFEGEE